MPHAGLLGLVAVLCAHPMAHGADPLPRPTAPDAALLEFLADLDELPDAEFLEFLANNDLDRIVKRGSRAAPAAAKPSQKVMQDE
ncbi:MAG: hypothetical protein R3F58_17740 [Steroidobacteraceae bacterium]|nr:hypothetical protein [Steroidobacteraceae bacterium]